MKRLFTLLIAILYLGVSSGIALQVHYCMDEIAAFTLMPAVSDKCDTCGMKGNSCCRDELTFFKLQDAHKHQVINFESQNFVSLLPVTATIELPIRQMVSHVQGYTDSSPPELSRTRKYVLHCRFNV